MNTSIFSIGLVVLLSSTAYSGQKIVLEKAEPLVALLDTSMAAGDDSSKPDPNLIAEYVDLCARGRVGERIAEQIRVQDCTRVKAEHLAEIKELDLSQFGDIKILPAGAFSGLSSLEYLDLSENSLEEISFDAFSGLGSLKRLYLNTCNLTKLPTSLFSPLKNLLTLDLSNNEGLLVEEYIFKPLRKLELLNLISTGSKWIKPGTFSSLGKLKSLDLSQNSIERIAKGQFEGLYSLKWLYLEDNEIKTIGKFSFWDLQEMLILVLRGNPIEELSIINSKLNPNIDPSKVYGVKLTP